jgi:hypothetical protein
MARPTEPDDPAEPDLYWAGHSGWAMLPGLVIGVAGSAVVMLAAPSVGNLADLSPDTTAFLRFWLVFIGWIAAGLVWAYRGASFVYRLTVRLADVTAVECRAWSLRRLFGVGAVVVRARSRPPLYLGGVFRPHQFAQAIRRAVQEAGGE